MTANGWNNDAKEEIKRLTDIRSKISAVRAELKTLEPPYRLHAPESYRDAEGCLTAAIVVLYEELNRLEKKVS